MSARARIRVPALTLCATALLSACGSAPPAPREARLDGGGASSPVRSVEGVVGSELTLAEIRTGFVEPRCAEAGLVMATLRVSRRPDGSQTVTARCGLAFR